MRSKLFVPGTRPELFAKALASDADAISIDLEDAVGESQKAEARENVAKFLRLDAIHSSGKTVIVRCNAPGTAHFEMDLRAVVQPSLHMLNLPKIESVKSLLEAIETLAEAESRNGIADPISILATIESPKGLRCATRMATAHSRVVGLQLGLIDLFESQGIDRSVTANVHAAMFAVRMAAAEAGVFAVDGAYPDIQNHRRFLREAKMARGLGFCGKSCIHPSQIPAANETFSLSAEEVSAATRVVNAAHRAAAEGTEVIVVDGKMIDLPLIRRAEQIVAASSHLRDKRQ